ncbi:MAG TPA: non-homologous end-joining DNA ligase [Solirubrobacter sp.]|jgi:DNA ligase D-like protein (predicted ligase)|nr:non-homologous end-joining DNA ligase [Solirubrobacter sp.]
MSAPAPTTAGAMKAVLTDQRFSDPDWIFERKLDGIRCIAIRDGGRVRLLSRNDLSLNDRYPEIAEALEAQEQTRFAVDGEVVAADGTFEGLAEGRPRLYYVFDIQWLDGEDVRDRPLLERKALLREALRFEDPIRFTEYRREEGEAMFQEACREGWEGIIAKRADSRYTSKRSRDWLKFKCEHGQELVIGGYTAPRGSRTDLGALLVGYYDADSALRYAGKVGTGFSRATLRDLAERLAPLRRDDPPFVDAPNYRDATWVEPELVGQFGFAEWTRAGRLRHPRFLGLRFDKDAKDVVREAPRQPT